jgi:hypothetical protein
MKDGKMKYKASFLGVPCWFDEEYNTIIERYGKINAMLLDKAVDLFCWIFKYSPNTSFPIKIYRNK